MFNKSSLAAFGLIASLGLASSANATLMSSLITGGSLAQDDVTFSNFTYTDVAGPLGDREIPASDIDVTTSSTAGSVSLDMVFNGVAMGSDLFEIFGGFDVTVGGGLRELIGVTMTVFGAVEDVDDFVEAGSNTMGGSAIIEVGSLSPQSFSFALSSLTSLSMEWDAQGEAELFASLDRILITYDLSGQLPPPPPPPVGVVPAPGVLALIAPALLGFGLLGARRKRV